MRPQAIPAYPSPPHVQAPGFPAPPPNPAWQSPPTPSSSSSPYPPSFNPSQPARGAPAGLVTPTPLYAMATPRPPPLQTSTSPTPFPQPSPSVMSGLRSPAPPVPGPPAHPHPYSHPPPSSVAPFPYPRAPLPSFGVMSPTSSSPPSSLPGSGTGTPPIAQSGATLHPFTFPLPPQSSAPHLPSPSSSNPAISTASGTLPTYPRPPPIQLPTSSSPPPAAVSNYLVTDEGPMAVPPSAGASPMGQHRAHYYPTAAGAGGHGGMSAYGNGLGARSQSYITPRAADKGPYANSAAYPLPPMPPPSHQPPAAAATFPPPAVYLGPPPPQPQHYEQPPGPSPSYAHPQPAVPYSIPPSLPARFSWVTPVSPLHVQMASSHFPDSPELLDSSQLPYGIFMNPLGPGLSLPVSESNPVPATGTTSTAQGTPVNPSTPASPSQRHARSPSSPGSFSFPSLGPRASMSGATLDLPYIPVVRPGTAGVIRCKECKAYINGYVTWLDQGRAWKCNICLADNPTPSAYFSPLNQEGRRHDWDERDELRYASYELHAPKDYMVRPPVPPLVCLCVDVSQQAQQRGMLRDICSTILPLLDVMAQHPKALLSVVTFSDAVHYYTINNKGKGPSMHVLSTLDDLFLPSPIGLLIRVADCKEQLRLLFSSLPTIHASASSSQICTASALECCMMIMGRYGGRLMTFVSSFCSLGRGLMTDRERDALEKKAADSTLGIEAALLKAPADNYYKKLSDSMQKHQITCDLFFFPPSYGASPTAPPAYVDVATYSEIARYTGGQLYYLPQYGPSAAAALSASLTSILTRPQCFESVFRVRVSKGVVISDFHGHFSIRGTDLLSLPCCDSEKGVSFELKIDEKEKAYVVNSKDRVVTVQTGLLYTSFVGERRIIVHTLIIPLAKEARKLIEGMNVDVCVGLMSKRAVWLAYAHSLVQAREFIRQKCASLVRVMQKTQCGPPPRGPLQPYMQAMPFTALCLYLLKTCFAEQGAAVPFISPDARAFLLSTLYVLPLVDSLRLIQPALIPLHLLTHDPRYGTFQPSSDPSNPAPPALVIPSSVPLSRASLSPDSVLLLHNAVLSLVRVASQADPYLTSQLFEEEGGGGWRMRERGAPGAGELLARAWDVLDEVRGVSGLYSRLVVVREGDSSDALFASLLVDDQRGKEPSLRDWDGAMVR